MSRRKAGGDSVRAGGLMGGSIPFDYFMVGGIGFLAAWLMAFMVMPAVHHRAVRLTRRQYDQLPLSIQEMRAEKDGIRAGFAAGNHQARNEPCATARKNRRPRHRSCKENTARLRG